MDRGVGGLENYTIFMDVICVSSHNVVTEMEKMSFLFVVLSVVITDTETSLV